MNYSIRNEHGVLILRFSAADAGALINKTKGRWRPRKLKSGQRDSVYELEEGAVFQINGVAIYLWSKYIVVRED